MTEQKNIVVSIHRDGEMHDPSAAGGDDGCWTIWTFNPKLVSFKHPSELHEVDGLTKKLKEGLAFQLGCYEHGQTSWFIQGEGGPGADCQWDGTHFAGIAIWEEPEDHIGAKTYEARKKDCAAFLENYTDWDNGHGYGYSISVVEDCSKCGREEEVEEIEVNYGYYGHNVEDMFADIRLATEGHIIVRTDGDASDVAAYHSIQNEETT